MDLDWYATTVSGKNIGTEIIDRAMGVVGRENVASLRATLGQTNRSVYDFNVGKGLSPADAAWQTPLGKSMNSLGLSKVQINNTGCGAKFSR